MKQIDYPKPMRKAVKLYHRQGGVVKYILFEIAQNVAPDYQSINLAALRDIQARNRWLPPENPDLAKMTSQPITISQFLGPYYDVLSQRLIVNGRTNNHLNDFFYHDAVEESQQTAISWENLQSNDPVYTGPLGTYWGKSYTSDPQYKYGRYSTHGYARAFSNPPHGLGISKQEKGALFNTISAVLFNHFQDTLEIRQWSNTWSIFFVGGMEWWGAYWWTVYNRTKNWVIVIGASATD